MLLNLCSRPLEIIFLKKFVSHLRKIEKGNKTYFISPIITIKRQSYEETQALIPWRNPMPNVDLLTDVSVEGR